MTSNYDMNRYLYMQQNEEDVQEKLQDMRRDLAALQEGTLPPGRIHGTIVDAGKLHMVEARPIIEPFLSSNDPEIRRVALITLAFDFGLSDYLDTALQFLGHDPDPYCRMIGASATGLLMRGTKDQRILTILARVVSNEAEEETLRKAAYEGMLSILGYSNREQFIVASTRFHFPEDVKWDLVSSYLGKE